MSLTLRRRAIRAQTQMSKKIGYVTLLVRDYDEAIDYYKRALGFALVEDAALSDTKRWVVVAPSGSNGTCLVLAKAATPDQLARIGDQAGGRVFLFLHSDAFWRDHQEMKAKGLGFRETPRHHAHPTLPHLHRLHAH